MLEINNKIISYRVLSEASTNEEIITEDIKLPDDAPARMKILHSEGKKWYLTIVYHPKTENPFALFVHTNAKEKSVTTNNAVDLLLKLARRKKIKKKYINDLVDKCKLENNVGKLTRTISLLLRHGVLIKNIVATLDKVDDVFVGSFLFQIKKFLSQYIKDGEEVEDDSCTECGGVLVYSEGCLMCTSCGSSKCQ